MKAVIRKVHQTSDLPIRLHLKTAIHKMINQTSHLPSLYHLEIIFNGMVHQTKHLPRRSSHTHMKIHQTTDPDKLWNKVKLWQEQAKSSVYVPQRTLRRHQAWLVSRPGIVKDYPA